MEKQWYSVKETYKTASGEYTFQEQKRKEEKDFYDVIDNYMENGEKRLLAVWGLPGCGKSYLLKKIVGQSVSREKDGNEIFAVYIDISDCADESEVYYKIALKLGDYYNIHKHGKNSENVKRVERLIRLYEWVKGIQKESLFEGSAAITTANDIADFISNRISEKSDLSAGDNEKKEDVFYSILFALTEKMPFVQNIKWMIDTALNIKELANDYGFKKWLLEKTDILDNRNLRQSLFLNELIAGISGVSRRMIVLDNFQMDPNKELGRDHTWLTTGGKMLTRMESLWIVVSRRSTKELFMPLFGSACIDLKLTGFKKELAERYLVENCFNCKTEFDYVQAKGNHENNELIEKMLEVCDFNEKDKEKIYLPYLLRLVVLYYWNLRDDPTITIKPESFARLNQQDDFVGFYFYKDLSDLMVNAFQILSCLSVWDSDWIAKVREKFDNHLLNARNVLEHKAPVERLDDKDSFKLHEALRDGLYRNGQNYIKKDVLGHFFDSFINIYGNKNLSQEDKKTWYELKKIEVFIEVVFEYINLQDEKENQKENLERIRPAMENIYAANSARGSVSDAFIRMYCWYIDKLGEVMGISFVKTHNNVFDKTEISTVGEGSVPDEEKQKQMIYYMKCCFKLADLYTNITRNGIAWKLEKLCVSFWEHQMKQIICAQADYQNQVWYYRCWQQSVKAINSMAFDHSAEHQYKAAYKFGKEGLRSAENLGKELLEHIEMKEEEKDILRMMLEPDENPEFSVGRAYTEIPYELHEKMKRAYKSLWEMCKKGKEEKTSDATDSFVQVLYDLMVMEYLKLRGNYPWYCLHNPELVEKDEISEKRRKKEACRYGARTYWIRRALSESVENTDFTENMLKSYHNVCVYLSKCGEYEEACFLEKEVLEETLQRGKPGKAGEKVYGFLKEVPKFAETDLQKMLWKNENLDDSKGVEFFSQSAHAIERMQYLGDYYLKLGYYSLAQKWLSKVMLMRSVTLGALDGKTLDTVIRFYVVLYANQEKDGILMESLKKYVEEKIFRSDEYIMEWPDGQVSNGLRDKLATLKEIIAAGNEGDGQKSRQKVPETMIGNLDL